MFRRIGCRALGSDDEDMMMREDNDTHDNSIGVWLLMARCMIGCLDK